jgi:hypothetical protein
MELDISRRLQPDLDISRHILNTKSDCLRPYASDRVHEFGFFLQFVHMRRLLSQRYCFFPYRKPQISMSHALH